MSKKRQHGEDQVEGVKTTGVDLVAAMRDRIVRFRRVSANQLEEAPWNWRLHGPAQQDAFAGSLEELGFYSPLEVRELEAERCAPCATHGSGAVERTAVWAMGKR